MQTIQLNISNDIFDKVMSFLEIFPKNKISVSTLPTQNTELKNNDFISQLVKSPKHVSAETVFLSRDEANER